MKSTTIALLTCIITLSCNQEQEITPALYSNTETIEYVIDGEKHPNWKISPDLKPDRLEVECGEEEMEVKFITDVDSIVFNIHNKDTIRFNVIHHKDTALTEIVGTIKNTNFSNQYISDHQGKFAVEIPEVHELANIMVAISNIGQIDSNMIDMTTKYHQQVLEHFMKFRNHAAIDTLNKHITAVMDNESYWYYYALKMNACGYNFNQENEIIDDGIIHKMGFNHPEDPFIDQGDLFTDFANKSNFRQFYKDHQDYYSALVTTYKVLSPIDKMQRWLEQKFDIKYGNYLVTFSPLTGGAHSTRSFKDNGFSQTVMFVSRSEFSESDSRIIDEMSNSKIVFTEIDHNFVNPISHKYLAEINVALNQRDKWVNTETDGTSAYETPFKVFNEYMTFAFYSLYCIAEFPKDEVDEYLIRMENSMINMRGFIKFKAFNRQLISLYNSNPDTGVDEMYMQMLHWCETP